LNRQEKIAMNLSDLYVKIRRATAHILVLQDGEKISEGSGFCFLPTGEILTAAHTVAGGFPIREGEVDQPNRTIVVRLFDQNKTIQYKPAICPIQISFSTRDIKPIQLDIAIIVPVGIQGAPLEYLTADTNPVQLGDEVYFGGYSNEIEFPFNADRNIDGRVEGMDEFRQQFGYGIKTLMAGIMIKHGIVGHVILGTAELNGSSALNVTTFYVDNQIHSGASGGPIVSRDGLAKGIIVKRAMTRADQETGPINVPSGSTWGISLDVLKALQGNVPSRT
jgi:Trypsin-like peptidase domain